MYYTASIFSPALKAFAAKMWCAVFSSLHVEVLIWLSAGSASKIVIEYLQVIPSCRPYYFWYQVWSQSRVYFRARFKSFIQSKFTAIFLINCWYVTVFLINCWYVTIFLINCWYVTIFLINCWYVTIFLINCWYVTIFCLSVHWHLWYSMNRRAKSYKSIQLYREFS